MAHTAEKIATYADLEAVHLQDRDEVRAAPFAAVPFSLGDLWPLDPSPVEGA